MGSIDFRPADYEIKMRESLSNTKVLVFTEGTILRPKNLLSLFNYSLYTPILNAVQKLKKWEEQGAEIYYLTSRKKEKQIIQIKNVLAKYEFPGRTLFFREGKEKYSDIVEYILPDVIVEDNCRSIGGRWQMAITYVSPYLKEKIKSVVVSEFKGIDFLPDSLIELIKKN